MNNGTSEQQYEIKITGFKDDKYKDRTANALSRVFKKADQFKIRKRLERLPWVVLKQSNLRTSVKLVRLLQKCGAIVITTPPIPFSAFQQMVETQVVSIEPTTVVPTIQSEIKPITFKEDKPVEIEAPEHQKEQVYKSETDEMPPVGPEETKQADLADQASHHDKLIKEYEPEPEASHTPPSIPTSPPPSAVPPEQTNLPWSISPSSISDILDTTFEVSKKHFWKLFAIQALSWVLNVLLFVGIGVSLVPTYYILFGTGVPDMGGMVLLGLGIFLAAIVATVIQFVAQGALIHACSCIFLGKEVSVKSAYLFSFGRIKMLAFTSIIVFLVIVGSLLAAGVIVAGVFFALYLTGNTNFAIIVAVLLGLLAILVPALVGLKLMMVDKVVIIEGIGYSEAVKRSWNLMTGKVTDGFPKSYINRLGVLLLLYMMLAMVINLAFSLPPKLIEFSIGSGTVVSTIGFILGRIGEVIGNSIASVFFSVALVVFYYDIRARKEGFDLSMLVNPDTDN